MTYPYYSDLPRYTVEALDIHTAYYEAGAPHNPPVILLHGMTSSGDTWRELMSELADDYWLIAPDIPGFGYSDNTKPYTFTHLIEWLAALRENLHIPHSAMIGHSFGGVMAARFAAAYPEHVSRLVLMAPALLTHERVPDFVIKAGALLGLIDLGTAVSQSKAVVEKQVRLTFRDPQKQHPSLWERRLRDYENARASADVLKAVTLQNTRSPIIALQQPTCLIWGENDSVVTSKDAPVLQELLPNVELHLLPECDHTPMLEYQEEVLAITRRFLQPNYLPLSRNE
jgi:pimeloyl-ACP methyl ester carboxylesterase